jgi:hypothetical protein
LLLYVSKGIILRQGLLLMEPNALLKSKKSNCTAQQASFSTFKNRITVKVLVGTSPG